MNTLMKNVKAFMHDEEGLTVVEYVVGAGLLVAGLGVIFDTLGSSLSSALSDAIGTIGEDAAAG
ncbi:Flp family type IVb pilin [Vibrio sp. ZSDE26]|uniref:Flp family type IVb pilin n=1 Tax=Vibrio amylolyticus TaxID=2847292 RepID=A0A9X1XIV0_9VIBR|nr:Flp family type IVb pilin [Vibrio amylolyticus]MCK6262453.1 Flp family type IVb pilin [Vibrio amylolyticus]